MPDFGKMSLTELIKPEGYACACGRRHVCALKYLNIGRGIVAETPKLIAAMGAETLTNAVRHAGARQLWIDMEETKTAYCVRYTNDGTVPPSSVTEGGGLSTARRKVEAAGGRMTIETTPRFMLTLIFEKGVKMDV